MGYSDNFYVESKIIHLASWNVWALVQCDEWSKILQLNPGLMYQFADWLLNSMMMKHNVMN